MQGGRLVYNASVWGPTLNEPAHLASGVVSLLTGRHDYFCVNPPLPRMVAAVPAVFMGCHISLPDPTPPPAAREEFPLGTRFVADNRDRFRTYLILGRACCVPFVLLGGWVAYRWSRTLWDSELAGLIAVFFWCMDPNICGHGSLTTPDCASASLCLATMYCFWRWSESCDWAHTAALGTLLGLALLSKLTAVLLVPTVGILWIGSRHCRGVGSEPEPTFERSRASGRHFLAALLLAGLVLNAGYSFDRTCTSVRPEQFSSSRIAHLHDSPLWSGTALAGFSDVPLPLPAMYVMGFDTQAHYFETSDLQSYLLGEWRGKGWWYYYVFGWLVKMPHGLQLLAAISFSGWLWLLATGARDAPFLTPHVFWTVLLFPIAVFVCVSLETSVNEHVRYVLPAYVFLFVLAGGAGVVLRKILERRFGSKRIARRCAILVVAIAAIHTSCSSLQAVGSELSYFNEGSGGSRQGFRYLLGSNYDWGQDNLLVEEESASLPDDASFYYWLVAGCDATDLGIPGEPLRFERPCTVRELHTMAAYSTSDVFFISRNHYEQLKASRQLNHRMFVRSTRQLNVLGASIVVLTGVGGNDADRPRSGRK
ncbi:hypothetical protein Mal4_17820 [Maioricimonas rarisocia]|uniref:Glycosyltransferase RgtA/B/C/D-like domain-containing protein n=2 Tax=Maioricimonas rarisocia TaxID=2528026 RepID=A0A517Z4S0_9PLAN|nr:hypothetical protein Mal4_17820 [Maioricimonas rarisocia]